MYRRRTLLLALATTVAGCATAKPNNVGEHPDAAVIGGDPDAPIIQGRPDAPEPPDAPPGTPDASPPDAMIPVPDAKPGMVTMTQTNATNIVTGNSVGCNDGSPFFDTAENSYYRAFKLSDYGVVGTFHVQHVDFGVEAAAAGGASQSVTVKLYTYTGAIGGTTLDTASMTPIAQKSVTVPDTTAGENISAAITADIPASATIVAEVYVPDGTTAGNEFFIGSNKGGETQPGYIRAPSCSTPTPSSFASVTTATVDILLTVTGSYQ